MIKVIEYWPAFVDRSEEPQVWEALNERDAMENIPFLVERGANRVKDEFIMKDNIILAIFER